jgi:hypothetical protein
MEYFYKNKFFVLYYKTIKFEEGSIDSKSNSLELLQILAFDLNIN